MSRVYVQTREEERCLQAMQKEAAITITGVAIEGHEKTVTGLIRMIEKGINGPAGYSLRVTLLASEEVEGAMGNPSELALRAWRLRRAGGLLPRLFSNARRRT